MKYFAFVLMLICVESQGQSLIYKFDRVGRLTQTSSDNSLITYSYDNDGNRKLEISQSVLAVQLLSFTATKQNSTVILNWSVTDETNINNYVIEFSINGTSFQQFATIKALNSSSKNNYSTTHCCPIVGKNYYRLKMIDKDGTSQYSQIKEITFDATQSFKVFPNPTTNKNINIGFTNALEDNAIVYVYNSYGIAITSLSIIKGQNNYSINLPEISQGTYFIVVNTSNKIYQSKFIKN